MQRPIPLSVVLLCCLGCTGRNGCAGDSRRATNGTRESSNAGEPLLTPVDDAYDPCSDFANFACGTSGGQALGRLQASSASVRRCRPTAVRKFLDGLASGSYQDGKPTTALLREVYVRCSDASARDLGLRELREHVDEVSRIEALPELARALGTLARSGIFGVLVSPIPFREAAAPDEPYVARVVLTAGELPRQAYAENGRLLAALRTHWEALATFVGGIAPSEVDGALRVDRWLAAAKAPELSYPMIGLQPPASRSRLEKARFPWRAYLDGLRLSSAASIRPAGPDTLARIDALARLPLTDLRSYLKVLIVERLAEYTGLRVFEEEIRFHHEIVDEEEHVAFDPPSACSHIVSRDFSPWIDEAYLASLPAAATEPTRELFDLLRDRFARTVAGASWLDDGTRRTAAAKASRIALRFAPDPDPGLDGVVLQRGSFLDAVWRLQANKAALYLAQIGAPGERTFHPRVDSGGSYSLSVNSIWLSVEYARDPWIQPRPFSAANFGSLGSLLGHEIGHALRVRGREFDDAGVRRETWSKEAVAAFESRTVCLKKQLGMRDVGAKWKVDAHRTLDEDVSELVGVQIAVAAMDAHAGPTDIQARDNQRREFFLAYAQQMCGTHSGHALHQSADEVHSPPLRILNGVLANVPEFAESFHCAPGTRMAPKDRCAIW